MATGSIILNFEAPDVKLTGTGEFDISETFKALFTENPAIKEQISNKITEIFKNIKADDIAKDWMDKIKKSLQLESTTIDLKTEIENKIKETFKGLNLEGLSIGATNEKQTKINEKFLKVFESTPFTNFLKAWGTPYTEKFLKTFSTLSSDFFKGLTKAATPPPLPKEDITKTPPPSKGDIKTTPATPPEGGDTVFDQIMKVTVDSFETKAMEQLSDLFGRPIAAKGKTKKEETGEDAGMAKKGFMGNIMNSLLAGMGMTAIPSILKGLAGPALLAGGLVWMAIDGIKGWMMADKWGTSKISAGLGGLLGGLGKGMEGAFKNAGKWALIGAGVGTMIAPVVGTIVGGLIGAAIGAILGWIGGEKLAKSFDAIGAWFQTTVMPELLKTWNNIKKWYYDSLKPAIEGFVERVSPILKEFGAFLNENVIPVLKNMWEGIKWIGALLGDVAVWIFKNADWIVAGLLDTVKKIWNGFVAVGDALGQFMFHWWEGFKVIKEKVMKFAKAYYDGVFKVIDWVKNKWDDTVEAFKNGFKKFFDWISGLGTAIKDAILSILPVRVQKWFKGEKQEEPASATKTTTVKTQAMVVDKKQPAITFQPAKNDNLYKMGETDIYAKKDDVLGKTFDNINKHLTNLINAVNNSTKVLNQHTQLFVNILNANEGQLKILPSLIPQAPANDKQFPVSNVRDPAYEYRMRIHGYLGREA